MINSSLIQNLTVEDLGLLDAETLTSPACIAKLVELTQDSLFDLEPGQARDFYENLNALLSKYSETLKNNPQIYNQLFIILNSVMWKAISALPAQVRREALTHNVILALTNNVNTRYYLQKYLDAFEFIIGPDMENRKALARFLETNDEFLGTSMILISNKEKAQPLVKNWLTDYNSYSQFNNIKNTRGHYEQVKYLSTSPNIQTLTKTEQTVLFKLIELYDWLLFPGQIRTNIPLVNELPTRQVSATPTATPILANESKNTPQPTNLAPAPKPPAVAPKTEVKPPSVVPLAPPPLARRSNVNLQDILNERMDSRKSGGVVWDRQPTNVDLGEVKKNVEQKRQETEVEIVKKLEELKKRKTSV